MRYGPIAYTMPQYEDYPNYWMKAYEQGTTTALPMATDITGDTTAAKFEINANGFPVTSGAALVIPFISEAYDLWLFPTEAMADANDTTNAIQIADNMIAMPSTGAGATTVQESTTVTMALNTNKEYSAGDVVQTAEFSTGDTGSGIYDVVLTSTVTPNTYNVIVGVTDATISFVLRTEKTIYTAQWGAIEGSDGTGAIQAALDSDADTVIIEGGITSGSLTLTSKKNVIIKNKLIPSSLTAPMFNTQSGSENSEITGEVDYTGTGETWPCYRSEADGCVWDVSIRGLEAPAVLDHSTCSGLQIRANNNLIKRVRGFDLANTGNSNPALPHVVSIEGDALDTEMNHMSCKGGAAGIVQSSGNGCAIGTVVQEGLSDNGLYVLSDAKDTTVDSMYYDGDEEPVVHAGDSCIIDSLTIKNQSSAIGLDDNTGLLVINNLHLPVDDEGIAAADVSSVIQSRNTSVTSAGVIINNITGVTYANRVFAFTNGDVERVTINNNMLEKRHTANNTETIIYVHNNGIQVNMNGWRMKTIDETGLLVSGDRFTLKIPNGLTEWSSWTDNDITMDGNHTIRGKSFIQDGIAIRDASIEYVNSNAYLRGTPHTREGRKDVYSAGIPTAGEWKRGDTVTDYSPTSGEPYKWVAVADMPDANADNSSFVVQVTLP